MRDIQLDIAQADDKPAPPCAFVLFGATGDLAARKIAPALYSLHRAGRLDGRTFVVGVARRQTGDDRFRREMLEARRQNSAGRHEPGEADEFIRRWHYHVAHAGSAEQFASLSRRLAELDEKYSAGGSKLYYAATAPEILPEMISNLGKARLNLPARPGAFARLVVEKPFGHDLSSARELNGLLMRHFQETQIYRIDHYLGKETVQNILVLRFANAIFDPLLNRDFVERVEITTSEAAGMEGRRGPYYEKAGALRDMVQNHMLQLLALVAMETPSCLRCDDIRSAKARLLESLRLMAPGHVERWTSRGQYAGGVDSPAYRAEKGVAPDSTVETYAAVKCFIDNPRWADVPFYLRTGKRLAAKASFITVTFRREPTSAAARGECDVRSPNRLVIRIYPDEGISIIFDAKVPGTTMLLRPVGMDFRYSASFESASPEAYEHLLLDAMLDDQSLFIRSDEVEASWRFIDLIRSAWQATGRPALALYQSGSWGPTQARNLFEDPYRDWHNI